MKVLFLDIDGVVNSAQIARRLKHGGILGIDAELAFIVGKISLAVPDLKIVLSSSWRHSKEGRDQVEKHVLPLFDYTGRWGKCRGDEIKEWLDRHPEVTCYAIIDDDSDMLTEQMPNFFHTQWEYGITEEIAKEIINHLSS